MLSVGIFPSQAQAVASSDKVAPYSSVATTEQSGPWYWPKGHYVIGTSDQPVTVAEYCSSLNQNNDAKDDGRYFGLQYYYDDHLMNSERGAIIRVLKNGEYHYSSRPGYEKQTVDYLEGYDALQDFKEWRKWPLLTEICDYINDQITIFSDFSDQTSERHCLAQEEAQVLREKYQLYFSDGFNRIDNELFFVLFKNQPDEYWIDDNFSDNMSSYTDFSFLKFHQGNKIEEGRKCLITISFQGAPLLPEASIVEGMDAYYRCPWRTYGPTDTF